MAAPEPTAPAEVVDDLGTGPAVVLLHGVGFGPRTLAPMASAIAERARVLVVRRAVTEPGAALAHQAAVTRAVAAEHLGDEPWLVAGVSGGATLALAIAATDVPLLGAIAHEPLLGTAAGTLAEEVARAHADLAAGSITPADWFAGLVGPRRWQRLDEAERAAALVLHDDLVAEAAPFVDWEPSEHEVACLRSRRLVITVGERSAPVRLRAAAAANRVLGAAVHVLPRTGHLVQFEAPDAFAASVHHLLGARR